MALSFAVWASAPTSPRTLDLAFGIGLLVLSAILGAFQRQVHDSPLLENLFLLVMWASVVVLASARTAEASALVWGVPLVLAAAYAAFYLPLWPAVLHVSGMVTSFTAVSVAVEPNVDILYTLVVVIACIAAATGVGILRRARDHYIEALAATATTDPLTGVLNRRGLEDQGHNVRAAAARG